MKWSSKLRRIGVAPRARQNAKSRGLKQGRRCKLPKFGLYISEDGSLVTLEFRMLKSAVNVA